MAEALLTGVLQQLATIISNDALQEVRLIKGVKEDVRNLKSNFVAICALLEDAEEKQVTNKSIKLWLGELKDAAYDMEDVLDEWNLALLKQQQDGLRIPSTLKEKVRRFLSCFSYARLASYHKIGNKIKEINTRLDEIAKRKQNTWELTKRESKQLKVRKETTPLVDVTKIYGRDEVKNMIKWCLLHKVGRPVQTISIVGMGGIGKTTLAQVIYNEIKEKRHFDKSIWVCVSDVFDEKKVAREILKGLEGLEAVPLAYLKDSVTLSSLMERICESIVGKKVFIVLDDVWTEDEKDWESLKLVFKKGAPGSRVLVTTRKSSVPKTMESTSTFNLEGLSEEQCRLILSQEALGERASERHKNLESIGREIAKKCKGLPLVAKSLGGLLRDKTTCQEWENVLNSEIWKLNLVQKDVFAPLLLSFHDLPSIIKRCFLHFAIYPKDTDLFKHHLVYQWMAQGFLGSDENEDMEFIGKEYFSCLVARCFIQPTDDKKRFKMHDIVHDFAQFLTQHEYVTKEVRSGSELPIELPTERSRHLTIVTKEGPYSPTSIDKKGKLRSIMFMGEAEPLILTTNFWTTVFAQSPSLRLIEIYLMPRHPELGEFSSEIGKQIHLRFLKLLGKPNSCMKELPEEICELRYLQYLHLDRCLSLCKLPDGIEKLLNLRVLATNTCACWVYYPKGIAKLTHLRVLIGATVRIDRDDPKQLSIGDLENLNKLQILLMKFVGNGIDETQTRRAKLHNKMHLEHIAICWEGEMNEADLLQHLNSPIEPFIESGYPHFHFSSEMLLP